MSFKNWLSKKVENFNIGLSDIGPDSHDLLPPMDSAGAFMTIGDDKPPIKKKTISSKKCNCGKKHQFGKRM